MARRVRPTDWVGLLESWDRQQSGYIREREQRFTVLLDVLAGRLGKRFRALDLGCGPGSLSRRLLDRFPAARVVAVDFDPLVMRIGREALRRYGHRITWVDADLRRRSWLDALPAGRFDAAVSTTALHWLWPTALRRLYRDVARRLGPRGILLNGDYLPWPARDRRLRALARGVHRVRYGSGHSHLWGRWWTEVEKTPELATEVAEHRRRFPHFHPSVPDLTVDDHLQALRRAGFREAALVWQDVDDRLIAGLR
ncbi:MAG TPA: class I SAM-dependent methyltransferase [Thermoplasmata archaeon]|nr:class I SAM-dependent methyltransferase [Thermoplasmata archaeon]